MRITALLIGIIAGIIGASSASAEFAMAAEPAPVPAASSGWRANWPPPIT
jgi:hypothetical protein